MDARFGPPRPFIRVNNHYYHQAIVRIFYILAITALMAALVACDPLSSVEYNVHNISGDTVEVTFYREIMTSPYQGYSVIENDSVTTRYQSDSAVVAVLAPNQWLTVQHEWHGLYREEYIVPAWRYIHSITQGHDTVPQAHWADESLWHVRTTGVHFGKGESRYYDLWLRNR